jgi:S1-C subfamily serine protease
MPVNITTAATLCTVRIEAHSDEGLSLGTGYFYQIETPSNEVGFVNLTPVIVTNKHVVAGAKILKVTLDLVRKDAVVASDGSVDWQERRVFEIGSVESVLMHPDAGVDLCVIQMGHVLNRIEEGLTPKNFFLSKEWRLSDSAIAQIRPIEPVIMIGYPNGIWDSLNNKPIVRKGLSATNCLTRWNGERYFVIDCACFPGSSGSPVFLYEDGVYRTDEGAVTAGTRIKLLGTLWGGPTYTAEGKLVSKPIPSLLIAGADSVPVVNIMMNLGFVIHADVLDDFVPIILDLHRRSGQIL